MDKLDDKAEIIKVLGNIANVHRDKGQHREALKESLENEKEFPITYNCIANELKKLNMFDKALIEIEKAIGYAAESPVSLAKHQAFQTESKKALGHKYDKDSMCCFMHLITVHYDQSLTLK